MPLHLEPDGIFGRIIDLRFQFVLFHRFFAEGIRMRRIRADGIKADGIFQGGPDLSVGHRNPVSFLLPDRILGDHMRDLQEEKDQKKSI